MNRGESYCKLAIATTMMKLLWIPIIMFAVSLTAYMVATWSPDNAYALRMFIGQGVMLPFFFFVLLFLWRFNVLFKRPAIS
jgi:hypothetical protein